MQSLAHKFIVKGISLANPVDLMPPGFYPQLLNVRADANGEIDCRQGIKQILATNGGSPVHSLRRVNDAVDSTFTRFSGIGTNLYRDESVIDSGYSGDPLSILPFRPNRSPSPYVYIADSKRMQKVDKAGNVLGVGILPCPTAPVVELDAPNYEFIDLLNISTGWTGTGTSSSPTPVSRFASAISQILYDTGNNRWACIVPASADQNLQVGMWMKVSPAGPGGEDAIVAEVHRPITDTIVQGILYEQDLTGYCSIVIKDSSPNLQPNSVINIGGEFVRVIDIYQGQQGASIRCFTLATHHAGETILGAMSFRLFLTLNHVTGENLNGYSLTFATTTGIGMVGKTGAIKLDVITPYAEAGIGGRPVSPDDYIHISLKLDNPTNLIEGRVILDIGDGSFSQNYLYKVITAADLGVTTDEITDDTESAQLQWTELKFKVSELIRAGTDKTKSLATVAAIGISINCAADVQATISSWWIGGTFGLDVTPADAPIQYAIRYRDSRTGAKSNPSPATRTGLVPQRDQAVIRVVASPDPQVDTIDLLRFGGGLNQWVVVGAHPNEDQIIRDNLPTLYIQANEVVEFDNYMPFPVSDLPHNSTGDVCGTIVRWTGGDKFDTRWVAGSVVFVNGVACTLYGSPPSDELLNLVESAGSGTDLPLQFPEPTIAGMPLPAVWQFGGQGIGTFMMGVGDPYNPGFLRWCKGNDPDAASDKGNLEITSPSEPLMNGCEYDGRSFVLSTERLFAVFPNFATPGATQFTAQVVVSNAGLFSRFAFCVTPYGIAWVSKDGIYLFSGSATPKNLTNDTLYPMFPHGGVTSIPVGGYYPPDYAKPLRLSFADNSLFFTYVDSQGNPACLRFDFSLLGWFPYAYSPTASIFYQEEGDEVNSTLMGGSDGNIYQFQEERRDGAAPIVCHLRTPSLDMGDSRTLKYFSDSIVDSTGTFVATTIGFNNHSITGSTSSISSATREQNPLPIALLDGDELGLYRNISLDLAWIGSEFQRLYEWQTNAVVQPNVQSTPGLVTQYTDHGYVGYSHLKEAWMGYISTAPVTFTIWVDGVEHSYTLPSSGGKLKKFKIMLGPLKGKMLMYKMSSDKQFIPYPGDMAVMVKPWGVDQKFAPFRPFQTLLQNAA